ncbi:MAG: GNAT family N-acetyltransferase [Acidimicrobiales bacterium]
MEHDVTLSGRYVRLEPLEARHAAALVDATSESRATYGFNDVPDGEAATRRYVAEAIADPDQMAFATRSLAADRIVGTTRYSAMTPWRWPPGHRLQRRDRPDVVEIGHTFLADSAQRTGINTEAKLLMMAHAFEVWEVHLVRIRTDVRNARSRAAVERLGYRFDGILRADRPGADGTVRDSAYYSMRRDEWPEIKARTSTLLR